MDVPLGKITACVITFNEADRIGACLDSLAFCDELLVVDSHSTDATRAIAAARGSRVLERDWAGYRSQKQFAIDSASHDWILFLDADERVTPELAKQIVALRGTGTRHAAYRLPFRSIYLGKPLRFGEAARESHVRLFDRRRCRFGGFEIHESVQVEGSTARLTGRVLHDSFRSLEHQLDKTARYARLMGESLHAAGKRASWARLLLNPPLRFLRGYVFRLGLLDGWRGLAVALIDANYVRQKYLHQLVLGRCATESRTQR